MARHKKEKDDDLQEPSLPQRPVLTLETINLFRHHHEPGVAEIAETLALIYSHPDTRAYISLAKFVNSTLEKIESYDPDQILSNNKDDKIFERINLFMKLLPEYNKTFEIGRKAMEKMGIIEPPDKEKDYSSFFEKNSQLNGDNQ